MAWLWRSARPDKHMLYFDLLEALEAGGCPVCRLGLTSVTRYLDALSYESVNDPGVRDQLRGARGFCNLHAWQFHDLRNGLGTAIIYHDVAGALLRQLEEELRRARERVLPPLARLIAGHGNAWSLPGRLLPHRACPACRALIESTDRYLAMLLAHLGDDELHRAYEAADGLCLPHVAAALARTPDDQSHRALLEGAARRLAALPATDAPRMTAFAAGEPGAVQVARPLRGEVDVSPVPNAREIAAAFRGRGCPVCRLADAATRESLAGLARGADDAGGVASSAAGPGRLCNRDAWRLLAWEPPPAVSAFWAGALAPLGVALQHGDGAGEGLRSAAPCPACRERTAAERCAAGAVVDGLAEAATMAAYGRSDGLCLAHYALAVSLATDRRPQRARLLVLQANHLRTLGAELAEHIRKHDHRFAGEAWGAGADGPERAIAAVAGLRELPGEDVADRARAVGDGVGRHGKQPSGRAV